VEQSVKIEMFETGIKVIDLLAPYRAAARSASRRRGRRQDRTMLELINNVAKKHGGFSVFGASASARARAATSTTRCRSRSSRRNTVLSKTALVYSR